MCTYVCELCGRVFACVLFGHVCLRVQCLCVKSKYNLHEIQVVRVDVELSLQYSCRPITAMGSVTVKEVT